MASDSEKVDHGPLLENQLEALDNEATSPKPGSAIAGPSEALDWEALRRDSLKTGGFGSRRASLWPRLLGVEDDTEDAEQEGWKSTAADTEEHADERQIKLDTDRSFVLYPVEKNDDRETLQESLHELLVALFRKRRKLGYFQGYHDIITVLYLTVPPRLRFACAEKMSLYRIRDSMGSGLEPVLGLLRITRNLLRLADKPFAETLERNSPLPFYALSNLLTLFSHDMPTLNLIQHVFDYLLCRPPIAVVYLAAVAILARKEEVLALQLEGEEGMAHSLLSTLPDLIDEDATEEPHVNTDITLELADPSPTDEQPLSPVLETDSAPTTSTSATGDPHQQQNSSDDPFASRARRRHVSESPFRGSSSQSRSSSRRGRDYPDAPIPSLPHTSPLHSRSPSQVKSPPPIDPTPAAISPPPYSSGLERMHNKRPLISLSSLLIQADDLRERFPPTHTDLAVDKVMGPQSVVFTWKEPDNTDNILDGLNGAAIDTDPDDAAEAVLLHPELIVFPYDPAAEKFRFRSKEEEEELIGEDEDAGDERPGGKRRRRKLIKRRPLDTKTIVTGAVIVLAVAMAAYGMRAGGGHGGGIFHRFAGVGQAQKKSHHWFGGALAGAAVKLSHLFGE